ncbi:MAG: hypothetical protein NTX59_10310 [Elusimicrobia bacterium]|nr:hypothetical protein [Elusimicrobiota bacterium]
MMNTTTKAQKQEKHDEDKSVVLDRFSYDAAYMFGEAMIKGIGWDTLNDAVENQIKEFIRTKEFQHLVRDDVRRTLSEQSFRDLWANDVLETLRDALPKLASEISVQVITKGRVQGRPL